MVVTYFYVNGGQGSVMWHGVRYAMAGMGMYTMYSMHWSIDVSIVILMYSITYRYIIYRGCYSNSKLCMTVGLL